MNRSLLVSSAICIYGLLDACSSNGSIPPVPVATQFSVAAPTAAVAGSELGVKVTALDASDSVVASYSGTVHFSSTDGRAELPANSRLTNGIGTFVALLNTAGHQTISATDSVTASITGTSITIDVSIPPPPHGGACQKEGEQCYSGHPCCSGLVCVPASTRAFCEPASAAGLEADSLVRLAIGKRLWRWRDTTGVPVLILNTSPWSPPGLAKTTVSPITFGVDPCPATDSTRGRVTIG